MWLFGGMTKDLATLPQLAKVSICHSPPSPPYVTGPELPSLLESSPTLKIHVFYIYDLVHKAI